MLHQLFLEALKNTDFMMMHMMKGVLDIIRRFYNKDKIIASICVGALPIGKSKILEGKTATTYNMKNGIRQEELRKYGVNVINKSIVLDDNIITSWNPSTAIDVAFKLLELLTSIEKANYIKEIMGFKILQVLKQRNTALNIIKIRKHEKGDKK